MKNKLAKVISVITAPSLFVIITLIVLAFTKSEIFGNDSKWLALAVLLLGIIPVLAYPISYIAKMGRDKERKLAFITSIIGYLMGMAVVVWLKPPKEIAVIFVAYFMSVVILAFVNRVIKVKASGHACGVGGPLALILYFFRWRALIALLILPIVFWSRMRIHRHTRRELVIGTLVGMLSTIISIILIPKIL